MKDKIIGGVILLTLLSLYVWALWIVYGHLWVIVLAVVIALFVSVIITKLIITAINRLTK